jgi:hypothetical protein
MSRHAHPRLFGDLQLLTVVATLSPLPATCGKSTATTPDVTQADA